MKCRLLSIAAIVLAAAPFSAAHAQIGIYGKFDGIHVSPAPSSNWVSPGWFKGPGGGVYFNVLHLGPLSLGGDVRGDYLYQSPQHYRDVLAGVRVALKAPVIPIRPYAQFSAGIGSSSPTGLGNSGTNYNNKFQYWVIGGVDYTVFPHIDWRVVEGGYGHMTGISNGSAVGGVNLFTVGTGIVLRLP